MSIIVTETEDILEVGASMDRLLSVLELHHVRYEWSPYGRIDIVKQPFHDEQPMVGPPDCSEAAFLRPLLRRCPFDLSTISWFWETGPPEQWFCYYAAQREAQNAALLEKIAAAVKSDSETLPIQVHAQPSGYGDAMDNLLAFSTEGRRRQQVKDADAIQISAIPHMKKCFGWLKIHGEQLTNLPGRVRAPPVRLEKYGYRQIWPDREYFAIVYEYIPEGDNDRGQIQHVLVDLSDIISPMGYCRQPSGYRRTDASRAFLPPPPPPSPPLSPPPSHAERVSQSDSDTSSASRSPPASLSSSDREDSD
ncbi:hypothetical protein C8A03DRAFT_42557 [Achaetomium macrosporum]|uniref:Uncharacterized protein n=1 Tax=Achaetomium macrosporum TaxID=79813 RepID=A0AAN7HFE8_9PEZI|nr:hypothetical protein C8A03DRAFT_42557 [Achaetomium macrosporum]